MVGQTWLFASVGNTNTLRCVLSLVGASDPRLRRLKGSPWPETIIFYVHNDQKWMVLEHRIGGFTMVYHTAWHEETHGRYAPYGPNLLIYAGQIPWCLGMKNYRTVNSASSQMFYKHYIMNNYRIFLRYYLYFLFFTDPTFVNTTERFGTIFQRWNRWMNTPSNGCSSSNGQIPHLGRIPPGNSKLLLENHRIVLLTVNQIKSIYIYMYWYVYIYTYICLQANILCFSLAKPSMFLRCALELLHPEPPCFKSKKYLEVTHKLEPQVIGLKHQKIGRAPFFCLESTGYFWFNPRFFLPKSFQAAPVAGGHAGDVAESTKHLGTRGGRQPGVDLTHVAEGQRGWGVICTIPKSAFLWVNLNPSRNGRLMWVYYWVDRVCCKFGWFLAPIAEISSRWGVNALVKP